MTKVYDLNPLIETHPAFAVMAQSESIYDLLSDVAVDVGGYGIIWNDELDLSCDELWSNGK